MLQLLTRSVPTLQAAPPNMRLAAAAALAALLGSCLVAAQAPVNVQGYSEWPAARWHQGGLCRALCAAWLCLPGASTRVASGNEQLVYSPAD